MQLPVFMCDPKYLMKIADPFKQLALVDGGGVSEAVADGPQRHGSTRKSPFAATDQVPRIGITGWLFEFLHLACYDISARAKRGAPEHFNHIGKCNVVVIQKNDKLRSGVAYSGVARCAYVLVALP